MISHIAFAFLENNVMSILICGQMERTSCILLFLGCCWIMTLITSMSLTPLPPLLFFNRSQQEKTSKLTFKTWCYICFVPLIWRVPSNHHRWISYILSHTMQYNFLTDNGCFLFFFHSFFNVKICKAFPFALRRRNKNWNGNLVNYEAVRGWSVLLSI